MQRAAVVQVFGWRFRDSVASGETKERWLPGLPGGVFNVAAVGAGQPVVVAQSILCALRLLGEGLDRVVAAGRPEGLTVADVEKLVSCDVSTAVVVSQAGGLETSREILETAGIATIAVSELPRESLAIRISEAETLLARSAVIGDDRGSATAVVVRGLPVVPETDAGRESPVVVDAGEVRLAEGRRTWRVRGASRVGGFDSLKVNVMVTDTVSDRFFIDTVDLYSGKSRAGFVMGAARELHLPEDVVKADLGRLLLGVEQAADLAATDEADEVVPMSEEDREVALAFAKDPLLTKRIEDDIATLGVVGERANALLLYLVLASRKCERPLGMLVQSSSAAGKSTLAEALLSLVPDEDTVSFSAVTGQSLFYLDRGGLARKVLSVAEDQGAVRATYAIKLLVSEGRLAIASTGKDVATGRLRTSTYQVAGPVSVLMTTTSATVDEELANRLVTIAVSEQQEQTRLIHRAQRDAHTEDGLVARRHREMVRKAHHDFQRVLEPLPVVIPMAASLEYADLSTRSRRDHAKYLGLICASALLHQHQRTKKTVMAGGEPVLYVEASTEDVVLADRLTTGVLGRTGTELPPATFQTLVALCAWAGAEPFTRRQAREALGFGDTQLKVHLARLVELEYVAAGRQGSSVVYQAMWEPPVICTDRSGHEQLRAGAGRGVVGGRSAPGRRDPDGSNVELSGGIDPKSSEEARRNARVDDDDRHVPGCQALEVAT